MGELVPRDDPYNPVPLRGRTARQVNHVYNQSAVVRATIHEREQNAAYEAQLRTDNGYQLADRVIRHDAYLDGVANHLSRGNPDLAARMRGVQDDASIAARFVFVRYMTR